MASYTAAQDKKAAVHLADCKDCETGKETIETFRSKFVGVLAEIALSPKSDDDPRVECRFCGKSYRFGKWLEKHEEKCPDNPSKDILKAPQTPTKDPSKTYKPGRDDDAYVGVLMVAKKGDDQGTLAVVEGEGRLDLLKKLRERVESDLVKHFESLAIG
jgi:hypothetical protein